MPNTSKPIENDRVREKLIESLYEAEELADKRCDSYPNCDNCPADNQRIDCMDWLKADCLLSLGVTVQQWIPVTERLPDKHGKAYVCWLTFPSGGAFPHILNWHEYGDNGYVNGKHFSDEGLDGMKVTHWMPLPQPPKGE